MKRGLVQLVRIVFPTFRKEARQGTRKGKGAILFSIAHLLAILGRNVTSSEAPPSAKQSARHESRKRAMTEGAKIVCQMRMAGIETSNMPKKPVTRLIITALAEPGTFCPS